MVCNSSGIKTNVQSTVEQPETYALARCTSNDNQLMYCDERMRDIKHLIHPIDFDGILIHDRMRFFKGKQDNK